jgi:hypothetical protein
MPLPRSPDVDELTRHLAMEHRAATAGTQKGVTTRSAYEAHIAAVRHSPSRPTRSLPSTVAFAWKMLMHTNVISYLNEAGPTHSLWSAVTFVAASR